MKKKIIDITIPTLILGIYLIVNNNSLYNNYYLKKKIILVNNREKIITLKNNTNDKYIYNFYLINNNLKNIRVFINNKEVSNSYIKDNNYIIYKTIFYKKETKTLSFKIVGDSSSINIEKIKYNTSILNYLKNKSSTKSYYIDTDNAKELYRFKNRYKYIGNVPNNYIYFNCKNNSISSCELYRIIGIEKIKKEEYIKIIKNNYENINLNDYNIYDRNKYLIKDSNIKILSIDDYIDSYRKVKYKCVNNIYKCNQKSYLTPNNYELVENYGKLYTISFKGNVIRYKKTNFYRPVFYLKKEVIVIGGDGSSLRPYIIK